MRVEHTRLEPIKGVSGREKTALTMKSIKQLLEEEAAKKTQVPVSPKPSEGAAKPELKATTAPVAEATKTVPPMPLPKQDNAQAAPKKSDALPPITPAPEPKAEKSRSLFGRFRRG